jgi:hypothetical protein
MPGTASLPPPAPGQTGSRSLPGRACPDPCFASWRPAATSLGEFLRNAGRLEYVRSLAADPESGPNTNLLGFTNGGGLLDKGVCWWHSQLTRAALFLSYFEPERPEPDGRGVRRIVRSLLAADRVVPIPGFSCLRDFSLANRTLVQSLLDRRQLRDGVLLFAWVNGLWGSSEASPRVMKSLMDAIHAETGSAGPAYVKLQIPGWDAHSWIVTETLPVGEGGYLCRYLDSNLPGAGEWLYEPGMTAISGRRGVPYLQRTGELRRMKRVIARFVEAGGAG